MSYAGETDIRYRLVKTSDAKRDSYHAVMKHEALTARETLEEICEATRLPRHTVESVIGGVLDTMIRGTLSDGRTRRFGNWFETRCDILGRFDRIDEEFDPARHSLAVNLLTLSEFGQYRRKNPPTNERQRPRGRIDYVTWPGGEKGEVKVGENNPERITSPDAMFFFCPWTRDTRPYSNAPMRGSSSHVKIIF